MADKRARGNCFDCDCDEKFDGGHKCVRKQLYRLELEEDVVEGEIGEGSECGEAPEEDAECGEASAVESNKKKGKGKRSGYNIGFVASAFGLLGEDAADDVESREKDDKISAFELVDGEEECGDKDEDGVGISFTGKKKNSSNKTSFGSTLLEEEGDALFDIVEIGGDCKGKREDVVSKNKKKIKKGGKNLQEEEEDLDKILAELGVPLPPAEKGEAAEEGHVEAVTSKKKKKKKKASAVEEKPEDTNSKVPGKKVPKHVREKLLKKKQEGKLLTGKQKEEARRLEMLGVIQWNFKHLTMELCCIKVCEEESIDLLSLEESVEQSPIIQNFLKTNAAVFAVTYWSHYVSHQPLVVRTDHKTLGHLMQQKLTTPGQLSWLPKLMAYDFEISYKNGSENVAVDALSKNTPKHSKFSWIGNQLRRKGRLVVGKGRLVVMSLDFIEGLSLSQGKSSSLFVVDGLTTSAHFLSLRPRYFGPFKVLVKFGGVAYKLLLPPTWMGHIFQLCRTLPTTGNATFLDPVRVLECRLVKRGNQPATQVLVHWANSFPEDATWEFLHDMQERFPHFKP